MEFTNLGLPWQVILSLFSHAPQEPQPEDDNHIASGHQLHASVKSSHASQTPLVTELILE